MFLQNLVCLYSVSYRYRLVYFVKASHCCMILLIRVSFDFDSHLRLFFSFLLCIFLFWEDIEIMYGLNEQWWILFFMLQFQYFNLLFKFKKAYLACEYLIVQRFILYLYMKYLNLVFQCLSKGQIVTPCVHLIFFLLIILLYQGTRFHS